MEVTFKAEDGRSVTQYHEVESLDKAEVEKQLQAAADEFEARSPEVKEAPALETGKDISVKPE
jgi:hypothetical protein